MSPLDEGLSLPVIEDDLWPPGQLLQLLGASPLGFKGGSVKGASSFIIVLTRNELIVKGGVFSYDEDEASTFFKQGIKFYEDGDRDYFVQDFVGDFKCRTSDISRVVLGKFGMGTRLDVWTHDMNEQERKVVGVIVIDFFPRTIMRLANMAVQEGLMKRSRLRGYNWHAWPLFRKEIERRFKQAAPSATILVEGRVLDDATFIRLVR